MTFTVTNAFRWWVRELPDQVALKVDGDPVTYRELSGWAGRTAAMLRDKGVKPGDRVGIMAANSLDFAVLMIGAMLAGAISAPVNFRYTKRELQEFEELLTPAIRFCDDERESVAREVFGEVHLLSEVGALRHATGEEFRHDAQPEDPLFVVGTSGSTGKSKSTIYTQRSVMTWAAEFALMEPLCGKGGRFLSLGPFSASSGTLHLFELIAIGNEVHIETQFRPERALEILQKERLTTFIGVPLFWERIAALPEFADADLSNLKFAQTAGARIAPELLAAWRAKGIILRQAYGCTEAGGAWAARDDSAIDEPGKAGHGGIFSFFAIAGERDGEFAPAGTPGEILVKSQCVTPGYWNNPEATAEALRGGYLHTGDLGVLDDNGNLTFVDRLKDIIISGGLNVSAMEVERVIAELPGIEEVAVIALNDKEFGETPLAIVYGPGELPSGKTIVDHCRANLAGYKVPRYVGVSAEPMPRVPAGKISKPVLRKDWADAASRLERLR